VSPAIIATESATATTGAIVYWTMSGTVAVDALAAEWATAGLPAEWLPKLPSPKEALRRVCLELAEAHVIVRKHKNGGWIIVAERWEPGSDKPAYDPGVRYYLDANDEIVVEGESHHTEPVRTAYAAARTSLASRDFSSWVVGLCGGPLGAVLLRETGGIYFVPQPAMAQFQRAKAAIMAASAHQVYEIPAVKSAESATAIFAAIQREVADAIANLETDLALDTIRGRTLLERIRTVNTLALKVGVYERLFAAPCGTAVAQLAGLAARLRTAAESKDKDACDVFAKLEIEMMPALPPEPVKEAPAPVPAKTWAQRHMRNPGAAGAAVTAAIAEVEAPAAMPLDASGPRDAADVFGKLEVD
jgi:hypothetical protein